MNHPLHLEIGAFLDKILLPEKCQLLLAPECGGTHNLPLFCRQEKSNDAEYCNVDAMVIKDGKICFLLEIEETGLTPTKICGKFLTSALSTHFIHDVRNNAVTLMDSQVTFMQVMDASSLKPNTMKIKQGQLLEASIQSILPLRNILIYCLFYFNGVQEFQSNETKKSDLQEVYLRACG